MSRSQFVSEGNLCPRCNGKGFTRTTTEDEGVLEFNCDVCGGTGHEPTLTVTTEPRFIIWQEKPHYDSRWFFWSRAK